MKILWSALLHRATIITDKCYNCSNNYEIFIISDYVSVYADHAMDKQILGADWSYLPQLVQAIEYLISVGPTLQIFYALIFSWSLSTVPVG